MKGTENCSDTLRLTKGDETTPARVGEFHKLARICPGHGFRHNTPEWQPTDYRPGVVRDETAKVVKGGSILLQKGGPGAGSSYSSPQSYEKETGQNIVGGGMSQVNEKLKSLMHEPLKKKRNIRFSLS